MASSPPQTSPSWTLFPSVEAAAERGAILQAAEKSASADVGETWRVYRVAIGQSLPASVTHTLSLAKQLHRMGR